MIKKQEKVTNNKHLQLQCGSSKPPVMTSGRISAKQNKLILCLAQFLLP